MKTERLEKLWWPHDEFAHHTPGTACACKPARCAACGGAEHWNPAVGKARFRQSWCERCRLNRWDLPALEVVAP